MQIPVPPALRAALPREVRCLHFKESGEHVGRAAESAVLSHVVSPLIAAFVRLPSKETTERPIRRRSNRSSTARQHPRLLFFAEKLGEGQVEFCQKKGTWHPPSVEVVAKARSSLARGVSSSAVLPASRLTGNPRLHVLYRANRHFRCLAALPAVSAIGREGGLIQSATPSIRSLISILLLPFAPFGHDA